MIKNCLVCGKEIHRPISKKGLKLRRSSRALTCSKKCSKIYTRISKYIRDKK